MFSVNKRIHKLIITFIINVKEMKENVNKDRKKRVKTYVYLDVPLFLTEDFTLS